MLPFTLTDEEYRFVDQIVQSFPKGFRNIHRAHGEIIRQNGQFRKFGVWKNLNNAYIYKRDTQTMLSNNFNSDSQQKLIEMSANTNQYLMKNVHQMNVPRNHLLWTQRENDMLIDIIAKCGTQKPEWGMISLSIPGRNGQSIQQHYKEMLARCEIQPLQDSPPNNPFGDMTRMTFLPCYEEILGSFIEASFYDGVQMDIDFIKEEAREFYNTPYVIAERITYEELSKKKKQIYTNEQKDTYTEEFKTVCRRRVSQFQISHQNMIKDIEESGFPEPLFSDHWVRDFMKRNKLSVRQAHFRRRGTIDENEVKDFLTSLVSAINAYGWAMIFNMDETSVRVNNGNDKTIAPVGVEEIIIPGDKNEKECFTCIATCSKLRKHELIMLGVGTTDLCCRKYGKNAMTWPSLGGWVDEMTMICYLNWLSTDVSFRKPCALVLDQYPSHTSRLVKYVAASLNIELIYIPKNATEMLQPLDRRIFGILKAKMRYRSKAKIYSGHERFQIIFEMLMKSWSEITADNLQSAWNIPQLNDILQQKTS